HRLDLRLPQLAHHTEFLFRRFCRETKRRRIKICVLRASQIARIHIEPRTQVGKCAAGVELHTHRSDCSRLHSEIFEHLFQIEILRLKSRSYVSVRWKQRLASSHMTPDKWYRHRPGGVLRRPLVELNLGNLERFSLR